MHQLAAGLKVLRAHNLIHRDLKPQNLLLTAGAVDTATLKIADFGFARSMQPHDLAETLCGSPLYMAPEILQFQKYDAKADLWSVGTILFELLVGRPPFGGANHMALLRNIEKTDEAVPPHVAAAHSPQCVHLLRCLLRRNPIRRVSFDEFFLHPFMMPGTTPASPTYAPFSSRAAPPGERSGGELLLGTGCGPRGPSYLPGSLAAGVCDSGTMSTASHSATQSGGGSSGTGGSGAHHMTTNQYDSYTEQQDSLFFQFESDSNPTSPAKPPPSPLSTGVTLVPHMLFPAMDHARNTGMQPVGAPLSTGFQVGTVASSFSLLPHRS
jgi:serine/threonine protein kinase